MTCKRQNATDLESSSVDEDDDNLNRNCRKKSRNYILSSSDSESEAGQSLTTTDNYTDSDSSDENKNKPDKNKTSKKLYSKEDIEEKQKKQKIQKRQEKLQKLCLKRSGNASKTEENESCKENYSDNSQSSDISDFIDDSEAPGINPELERDKAEILNDLSRNTERDYANMKDCKEQHGKVQLAIHSVTNRSLYTSEEKRYGRHMRQTNFDLDLKLSRGLNRNDDEFHEWIEINVMGQAVKINRNVTPITAMYNGVCVISNCGKKIQPDISRIIQCKLYNKENNDFVKKIKFDGTEGWFYICHEHYRAGVQGIEES